MWCQEGVGDAKRIVKIVCFFSAKCCIFVLCGFADRKRSFRVKKCFVLAKFLSEIYRQVEKQSNETNCELMNLAWQMFLRISWRKRVKWWKSSAGGQVIYHFSCLFSAVEMLMLRLTTSWGLFVESSTDYIFISSSRSRLSMLYSSLSCRLKPFAF